MKFCHIPAGRFRMGQRGGNVNEEPVTEVEVAEFWMGESPVTQEQYGAMAEGCPKELSRIKGNCGPCPDIWKNRDHSVRKTVENVNWYETKVLAGWLDNLVNSLGLLPTNLHVRLPSEAEWEYACRAGSETESWGGDEDAALSYPQFRTEVATSEKMVDRDVDLPNAWGLHYLHPNVSEWCDDTYSNSTGRIRLSSKKSSSRNDWDARDCVTRGGSHVVSFGICRSAHRLGLPPNYRDEFIGFRLCLASGHSRMEKSAPELLEGWRTLFHSLLFMNKDGLRILKQQ